MTEKFWPNEDVAKLDDIELVFAKIKAVCFAGQVDARALRKAKGFKEIEECVAAHFLTQPDHVRVAGIANTVHQRFRAVTGMVPTADGVDGGIIKHPLAVQVYVESSEATPVPWPWSP